MGPGELGGAEGGGAEPGEFEPEPDPAPPPLPPISGRPPSEACTSGLSGVNPTTADRPSHSEARGLVPDSLGSAEKLHPSPAFRADHARAYDSPGSWIATVTVVPDFPIPTP